MMHKLLFNIAIVLSANAASAQISSSKATMFATAHAARLGNPPAKGEQAVVTEKRHMRTREVEGYQVHIGETMIGLDLTGKLINFADMSRSALLPTSGPVRYKTEQEFIRDIQSRLATLEPYPGLVPEPVAHFRKPNPSSDLIEFRFTQSAFGYTGLRFNQVSGEVHRRTGRFVHLHMNRNFTIVKPNPKFGEKEIVTAVCMAIGSKVSDWRSKLEYQAIYDFKEIPELEKWYGGRKVRLVRQVYSRMGAVSVDVETGHAVSAGSPRKSYDLAEVNRKVRSSLLKR